jgi:hypothetical protein
MACPNSPWGNVRRRTNSIARRRRCNTGRLCQFRIAARNRGPDGAGGLKILFFDLAWRGTDAAEFKNIGEFMSLEEMKLKIEQGRQKQREQKITIDTTLAGGFDPAAGKERYYQLDCIRILLDLFRDGKMKMLVHMATGLGKRRRCCRPLAFLRR